MVMELKLLNFMTTLYVHRLVPIVCISASTHRQMAESPSLSNFEPIFNVLERLF